MEERTSIKQTNWKDYHHTEAHPQTGKTELKSNEIERMGWNFTLYTLGITKEQKVLSFYNVVGPPSVPDIQAQVAKHLKRHID